MPWTWFAILAGGAVVGGLAAGWLPEPYTGKLMPGTAWIGLVASYPLAGIVHERGRA